MNSILAMFIVYSLMIIKSPFNDAGPKGAPQRIYSDLCLLRDKWDLFGLGLYCGMKGTGP